jgi:two-component system chemotaxis response regulator CheB
LEEVAPTTPPPPPVAPFEIVTVTSGRGGIASVIAFVSRLPPDFPLPVVLFETIPRPLIPSYTQHLARICKLSVVVAEHGEATARSGQLLVLPSETAICTGLNRFRATGEGTFLHSVAAIHGARTAAVVLAGTAQREKEALKTVAAAGGLALSEDTKTPVSEMANQVLGAVVVTTSHA